MNDAATTTTDRPPPPSQPNAPLVRAGRQPRAIALFLVVALGVLALDLAVKAVAFRTVAGEPVILDPRRPDSPDIPYHEPINMIPGLLSLRLTTNTGAVFGLGQGGRWVFIAVSIVAVGVITRIFWRSPAAARGLHLALALILAGALGNLYDRFRFSAVRDMLHLFPGWTLPFGWTWPGPHQSDALYPWIFNLADAALVIGVVGVLVVTWRSELSRSRRQTAPD